MELNREFFENIFFFIIFCGALYFAFDYSSRNAQAPEIAELQKPKSKIKHIPSKHDFSFFDPPPKPVVQMTPIAPPKPAFVAPVTSSRVSLIPFVQNDDLCGLSAQLAQKDSLAQKTHDLFTATGANDEFGLLNHDPSPLFGKINSQPTSDATRFYNALLAGNLLVGAHLEKSDPSDLKKADRQLESLKSSRTQNAAYAYFQIATAWSLRHDTGEIQRLVQTAAQGSEFETYLPSLENSIYQAGLTNPTAFMLSVRLTTTVAVPDFAKSVGVINQVNVDHQLDDSIFQLSQTMMREAQQSRISDTQYGSSALQYQIGLRLQKTVDPNRTSPSYPDLMEQRFPADHQDGADSLNGSSLLVTIPQTDPQSGTCLRQDFDNAFYRLRR